MIAVVLAVVLLASTGGVAMAGIGNNLPTGSHYNLNIIAKKYPHPEDGEGGNVIFVDLGEPKTNGNGNNMKLSKIYLQETPDGYSDFYVKDNNATGGSSALFYLPNPACADTSDPPAGATKYQVFVRIQGKPDGSFKMYTCGENVTDGTVEEWCSEEYIELTRPKGNSGNAAEKKAKNDFTNVSTELLTVYVDVDEDGTPERYYIFDPIFQNYLWKYENNGAKLVQLRFYQISSCPEDL